MPSTRNAPLRGTLVNEASNPVAACLENGDTRCALHASQHPGRPLLANGDAAAALAAAQVSETGLFGWHADGKATSPQRRSAAAWPGHHRPTRPRCGGLAGRSARALPMALN